MTCYVSLQELAAATPRGWSLVGLGAETTPRRERESMEAIARSRGVEAALSEAARRSAHGLEAAAGSGDSLCLDDLRAPAEKPAMIAETLVRCAEVRLQYDEGLITDGERYNKVVDLWSDVTWRVRNAAKKAHREVAVPLDAWCERGATEDRRDALRGMVGLVAKPSGEIIEMPVLQSVGEGLSPYSFFVRARSDRHMRMDDVARALATRAVSATLSWALDRRRVTTEDCGTDDGHPVRAVGAQGVEWITLARRIAGRTLARDVISHGEVIARSGAVIDVQVGAAITAAEVSEVHVRWVLGCRAARGVCARCLGRGWLLQEPPVGARIGTRAARALGSAARSLHPHHGFILRNFSRPYTPYTQAPSHAAVPCRVRLEGVERVFREESWLVLNSGGFMRLDDREGHEIARAMCVPGDRLFADDGQWVEARTEIHRRDFWSVQVLAAIPEGTQAEVRWLFDASQIVERVSNSTPATDRFLPASGAIIELRWSDSKGVHSQSITAYDEVFVCVAHGATVTRGDLLVRWPSKDTWDADPRILAGINGLASYLDARITDRPAHLSRTRGWVSVEHRPDGSDEVLVVRRHGDEGVTQRVPRRRRGDLQVGGFVDVGSTLTYGICSHRDLLRLWGRERVAELMLEELREIFARSGETPEEAHLELVVAAMLSRVRVRDAGDTSLSVGSLVSRSRWLRARDEARARGLREPRVTEWLSGISQLARDEAARG